MSFTMTVRTANAAFSEGYDEGELGGSELARILREVADRLESAYLTTDEHPGGVSRTLMDGTAYDYNGNAVGEWRWTA